MEVTYSEGFYKSLKKMFNRFSWYYRLWELFRYDIPRFFKNIFVFRKALWSFTWYNGESSLNMFKTGIIETERKTRKQGLEIESSRMKKVDKMKRAIYLMDCFVNDNFIDLAEKELGLDVKHGDFFGDKKGEQLSDQDQVNNGKIFDLSRKLDTEYWTELWQIIKGQEDSIFKIPERLNLSWEERNDYWDDQFDGSGLRGWWD